MFAFEAVEELLQGYFPSPPSECEPLVMVTEPAYPESPWRITSEVLSLKTSPQSTFHGSNAVNQRPHPRVPTVDKGFTLETTVGAP